MSGFKLSAVLEGHGSDVRSVAFPDPNIVLTASRDGSTRIWKLSSTSPPDPTELSHGATYKTCVVYLPPTKEYPDGLVISSGQDTLIEARKLDSTSGDNAEALMVGHSNQVCTLDINSEKGLVVSGSWDGTARLWKVGRWEPEAELQGHDATVWAVLAYDSNTVITGSADQSIQIFDASGKRVRKFGANAIVRALTRLDGHDSRAQFASAGNDSIIRLWTLQGEEVGQLHGHTSFIYALATLPSGEIVSSSEDRTARIWRGNECVQTITHPALSVWSVAVCQKSGDIVTGASDKMARIFTQHSSRFADAAEISKFEESVRASTIPKEQVGEIRKTDLPGPAFLQQKSGTKDGQVQMIKEDNGTVTAYQWSAGSSTWVAIGSVVDSAPSNNKKMFNGKEYDYVFDVDIAEGQPPLKLPYNAEQNPYDAATKFLQDNELPMSYLEETANFIIKSSEGASFGAAPSQPSGADPWGQESRYRPGEQSSYSKPSSKKLPQREYLPITVGKPSAAISRIKQLGTSLSSEQSTVLDQLSTQLESHNFDGRGILRSTPALKSGLPLAMDIAATWEPLPNRLAPIDLLRFLAAGTPEFSGGNELVIKILSSGIFSPETLKSSPKLAMVTIRLLANLCCSETGRKIIDPNFDPIASAIRTASASLSHDLALDIAISTFYLNASVSLTDPNRAHPPDTAVRALATMDDLISLLKSQAAGANPEPTYRALVAVGTLLVGLKEGREDVKSAAEIHDLQTLVSELSQRRLLGEARFAAVVEEVRGAL